LQFQNQHTHQNHRKNNLNATFRNLHPFLEIPTSLYHTSQVNGGSIQVPASATLRSSEHQLSSQVPLMNSTRRKAGLRRKSLSESTLNGGGGGVSGGQHPHHQAAKVSLKPKIRIDSCEHESE
jgi:hypothetical protein